MGEDHPGKEVFSEFLHLGVDWVYGYCVVSDGEFVFFGGFVFDWLDFEGEASAWEDGCVVQRHGSNVVKEQCYLFEC